MMAKCSECGTLDSFSKGLEQRVKMALDISCPKCNKNTIWFPTEETQENWPNAGEHQERMEIDGVDVWADPEMIPLLKMMNKVGLKTRSHCSGHGNEHAWVVLRMDNIEDIQVRNNEGYKELIIGWKPPEGFAKPEQESREGQYLHCEKCDKEGAKCTCKSGEEDWQWRKRPE